MGGTKHDAQKPRLDLIPAEALVGMGEVLGFGAEKYDAHNWRKGIDHSRLFAAAQRHLWQYWNGDTLDDESGLNHLKHAMTNIAMMLASPEYDDRYQKKERACETCINFGYEEVCERCDDLDKWGEDDTILI